MKISKVLLLLIIGGLVFSTSNAGWRTKRRCSAGSSKSKARRKHALHTQMDVAADNEVMADEGGTAFDQPDETAQQPETTAQVTGDTSEQGPGLGESQAPESTESMPGAGFGESQAPGSAESMPGAGFGESQAPGSAESIPEEQVAQPEGEGITPAETTAPEAMPQEEVVPAVEEPSQPEQMQKQAAEEKIPESEKEIQKAVEEQKAPGEESKGLQAEQPQEVQAQAIKKETPSDAVGKKTPEQEEQEKKQGKTAVMIQPGKPAEIVPVTPITPPLKKKVLPYTFDEKFEDEEGEEGEIESEESEKDGQLAGESEEEVASASDLNFNATAKRKAVMELIERGADYLKKRPTDEVFSEFTHGTKFTLGELYLFVFNSKGICMAHGDQEELLWQNLYNLKDTYGVHMVQSMIERARLGGGWVTYQWKNATKISYVKEVRKDNKVYILGCGFYPHSKADAVVNLVKGAVGLFNDLIKHGRSKEEAFSPLSYQLGRFVLGDLYLYAVDFKGLQVAHGEQPGLVGSNAWNYKDANGKLVNQEIIAALKDVDFGTGVWVDYVSRRAPKKAYAEKVVDETGKMYFIACGYYPDADREHAINLVERAYRYMKGNGKTQSVIAFTDKGNDSFRYGDLYIVVYDMKGVCIAHGGNATSIGKSMYNEKDNSGSYYVREMLKTGESGHGGWVNYKDKNSFRSVYVERVDLGVDDYIVTCGMFPINKRETMNLLAKGATDYLHAHDVEDALGAFVKDNGTFIRGDLMIFCFDAGGICLAYGDDHDLIWRNLLHTKDQTGEEHIKKMMNLAKHGAGMMTYQLFGATKLIYVDTVEKNGVTYIIGSGFYL